MTIGLGVLLAWIRFQDDRLLHYYFNYLGALFFVGVGTTDLALCWKAFRRFSTGEPLRTAWLLITLASAHRLVGLLFSEVLSVQSLLNPGLLFASSWDPDVAVTFRQFGLFASGPVQMVLLACGLLIVIGIYRKLGMLPRFKVVDYVLLAGVFAFTAREIGMAVWMVRTGVPESTFKVLNWASDPLLCVLLFEAVLVRRAVLNMGWGLIAECWGALMIAIVITSIGDMGIWATANGYLPWPFNAIAWFVWYPASTAFALAPAYQLEAIQLARNSRPTP